MTESNDNIMIDGPYCDIQSHNLILQVMDYDRDSSGYERSRRDYLSSSLEKMLGEEGKDESREPKDVTDKLKDLLEKKGKAFLHTAEYYQVIEDEQERMKAYRGLKVSSTVPYGEDAEIAENPFKFLHLPEDATFGQTRAAWIRLSKSWFPDLMYPENPDQYKRIFGDSKFPIEGKDYDSWLKEMNEIMPPETLSAEELEKLGTKEQQEYMLKKEAYRNRELEYEQVKSDMRLRATQKMQTLNKAYAEAKKRFSDLEQESFAGFLWERGARTSDFMEKFMGDRFSGFEYDGLNLEGDGQVRRDMGRWASNSFAYLAFDYGEVYLGDQDYRQSLNLRSFFAWTELVQGKELCPTLLEDMIESYKLNEDQSEQLRLMIMNREEPDFIVGALEIPTEKYDHYKMLHLLEDIYDGPMFSHDFIGREIVSFPLGVEFTQEDGLKLTYRSQMDSYSWTAINANAQFSPTDIQMMRAIAYGPLLQKLNTE